MGDFKRSGKKSFSSSGSGRAFGRSSGGSGWSFGKRDSSGPRRDSRPGERYSDRAPRRLSRSDHEMHEVTCDKCGRQCEVPFKPTSNKPVYCSDCFKKNDDRQAGRRFSEEESKPGVTQDDLDKINESIDEINEKLDKILVALNVDQD
jgi:CxxC-x17-CxxC domain-containing protein